MNKLHILIIITVCGGLLIPAYFLVIHLASNEKIDIYFLFMNIFFSAANTGFITGTDILIVRILQKKLPWENNKIKRFFSEFLLTSFNAALVITTISLLFYYLFHFKDPKDAELSDVIIKNIMIALVPNTIGISIYESIFLFKKWKKSLLESEQLKREKTESQFEALKNQVNPHFLFNNLNSLSSLIRISPDKAIDFVDRFSKIYRYVLDVSDKIVVQLSEEIDFLQSYYFLQQTRFGNNLKINTNIDASILNDYVLPLSIQLLIENVIKHNEVSTEFPMVIEICTEENYLVVKNKLQKKNLFENKHDSHGIGLINLTERYKHLTDIEPKFYVEDNQYIAKIPLLKESI